MMAGDAGPLDDDAATIQAAADLSSPASGDVTSSVLRRRASAGVLFAAVRGVLIRLVGLGGTLILSRLLTPREFGLTAIGVTFVLGIGFISDVGVGAGFVRRPEPPTRAELKALCGLQMTVLLVLVVAVVAGAVLLGGNAWFTALMVLPLPINALRSPAALMLERDLNYRAIAKADVVESCVYQLVAVVAVASGLGVWGVAVATGPRVLVGAIVTVRLAGVGFIAPSFKYRLIRELVAFGAQYQAAGVVSVARDAGMNIGLSAFGSLQMLGVWSLTWRVLQIPFLLFDALWRVSYPAVARLLQAGEDAGAMVRRGLTLSCIAVGLVLAPLMASSRLLVPEVFGDRWDQVGELIPLFCIGLAFSGPVSVATGGYLTVVKGAGLTLRVVVANSVTWLIVTFLFLPVAGIFAVAYGFLAAAVLESVLFLRFAERECGAPLRAPVVANFFCVTTAGLCGWALGLTLPPALWSATLVGAAGAALFLGAQWVLDRTAVKGSYRLLRASMQSAGV